LQAKFESQEQANKIMQERLQKELEKRKKFDTLLDKLVKNPKLLKVLEK